MWQKFQCTVLIHSTSLILCDPLSPHFRSVASKYSKCIIFLNNLFFPKRSGWSPAPAGFAPSFDWQMQQTADFADIRQVPHITCNKLKKR